MNDTNTSTPAVRAPFLGALALAVVVFCTASAGASVRAGSLDERSVDERTVYAVVANGRPVLSVGLGPTAVAVDQPARQCVVRPPAYGGRALVYCRVP